MSSALSRLLRDYRCTITFEYVPAHTVPALDEEGNPRDVEIPEMIYAFVRQYSLTRPEGPLVGGVPLTPELVDDCPTEVIMEMIETSVRETLEEFLDNAQRT